jgi:ParB-like chromosome segregation protein Spo0J
MTLPVHPLALLLPSMPAAEYEELVESIRQRGLQEPIWTLDGKVLDGRHRDRACDEAAVTPSYREYDGPSPAAFVLDANIHRRHLDPGQRATIAQEFEPALAEEAKGRQEAAGKQHGRGQRSAPTGAQLSPAKSKRATEEAAALTGASAREVQRAKRVQKHAPELLPDVKAGKMSLRSAERVAIVKQAKPMVDAAEQQAHLRRNSELTRIAKAYAAVNAAFSADLDAAVDAAIHDVASAEHREKITRCIELMEAFRDAIKPTKLRRVQ